MTSAIQLANLKIDAENSKTTYLTVRVGSRPQLAAIITFGRVWSILFANSLPAKPGKKKKINYISLESNTYISSYSIYSLINDLLIALAPYKIYARVPPTSRFHKQNKCAGWRSISIILLIGWFLGICPSMKIKRKGDTDNKRWDDLIGSLVMYCQWDVCAVVIDISSQWDL